MGAENEQTQEHEALQAAGFDRPAHMAKYIIGKVLKFGAIAALAGAVGLAGIAAVAGLMGIANPIGIAVASAAALLGLAPVAVSGLGAIATFGATWLGAAGAALGLVLGISGAGSSADQEKDTIVDNWKEEKNLLRQQETVKLALQKKRLELEKQERANGIVPPTHGLGHGTGMSAERAMS